MFQTDVLCLWPFWLPSGCCVFFSFCTTSLSQADLLPSCTSFTKQTAKNWLGFSLQSGIIQILFLFTRFINTSAVSLFYLLILTCHLEMCSFEMSGTGENIVLRTRIHKIDFDSVLKLRDMCIFGSDTPSFHFIKEQPRNYCPIIQFK